MQPGLTRAVPMSLLGFLLGAAFVILLRALQSMDPVWDAQIGLLMGGFISLVFFVWGIGAFNPELSEHHAEEPPEGEESSIVLHEEHAEADYGTDQEGDTPGRVLGGQIWTITFWTLIVFLAVGTVAATPGLFALTISNDAAANRNAIGFFTVDLGGGNVLVVSQLAALLGLAIFTILSLLVAAGIISAIMLALSRNVREVATVSNSAQLTAGRGDEAFHPGTSTGMSRIRTIAVPLIAFIVIFAVLYILFYGVFIGLVLPQPENIRVLLSVVNAALFALLLVRPRWIVLAVGHGARWLARALRGLPAGLGQK